MAAKHPVQIKHNQSTHYIARCNPKKRSPDVQLRVVEILDWGGGDNLMKEKKKMKGRK